MKHSWLLFEDIDAAQCNECGLQVPSIKASLHQDNCPGTGAHMKIGHFGGIKPGDILPVADIYESNCGEGYAFKRPISKDEARTIAEAKNWFPNGVVKNRPGFVTKEAYDELMAHLQLCVTREAHENVVHALQTENARLKARIRALEPEQPQPRPLYRWGRPV